MTLILSICFRIRFPITLHLNPNPSFFSLFISPLPFPNSHRHSIFSSFLFHSPSSLVLLFFLLFFPLLPSPKQHENNPTPSLPPPLFTCEHYHVCRLIAPPPPLPSTSTGVTQGLPPQATVTEFPTASLILSPHHTRDQHRSFSLDYSSRFL